MNQTFYIASTKYTLQERKTKKHGTVYDIVFRVYDETGKRYQKRLGGFATKGEARLAYTDFITNNAQRLPKGARAAAGSGSGEQKIGDLFRLYLQTVEPQLKPATLRDKEFVFRALILPEYADLRPSDLTKEELYRWQDRLIAKKNPRTGERFSFNYLKKARSHFRAFLEWSSDRFNTPNRLTEVKPFKNTAQKKIPQFWTREEFETFLTAVEDPTYRALFTVLFFTGRRKGEVFALSPADIDYEKQKIRFDKSVTQKEKGKAWAVVSTKKNKSADIPVSPKVIAALRSIQPGDPFFFGGAAPLSQSTVTRKFDTYIEKAGVKRIRIHDLRHSFVSMLIHNGVNITVVADLISDTPEQVMRTYGHLYAADQLSAVSML